MYTCMGCMLDEERVVRHLQALDVAARARVLRAEEGLAHPRPHEQHQRERHQDAEDLWATPCGGVSGALYSPATEHQKMAGLEHAKVSSRDTI